jgi:AAA15 family ATPase/GTPase
MGDGYKTLIGFLWKFLDDSGISDIVYMEEPENHLHPGYIKQTVKLLVEMVKEENLQIYITTHSLDLLSEFFSDSNDEQYLRENFQLIQMTQTLPKVFDYNDAEKQFEDLQMDLRGI